MTASELVKLNDNIVMPAVNATQAVEAWKQYEEMKKAIVTKSDIQKIQGNDFLKKSYWRKIATFFNLSIEVVEEKQEQIGKTIVWHFTCRAIAPNGRFAVGVGSCDAYEKAVLRDGKYMSRGPVTKWNKTAGGKSYPSEWEWVAAQPNSLHNIRTTAETRATNRAISNLVGGGEVSAEEIYQDDHYQERAQEAESVVPEYINDFQKKKIVELGIKLGYTEESIKDEIAKKYKAESFEKVPLSKAGDEVVRMTKEFESKGKEQSS